MPPSEDIAVSCPGVPAGRFLLVRTRIYTARGGCRYDMKLLRVDSREVVRGSPAGPQQQIQIRFSPGCRWYLHRLIAFEKYRLVHGMYPPVTHQAHHRDFHYTRSFWAKLFRHVFQRIF